MAGVYWPVGHTARCAGLMALWPILWVVIRVDLSFLDVDTMCNEMRCNHLRLSGYLTKGANYCTTN